MKTPAFIKPAMAVLAVSAATLPAEATAQEKPNFVIILCDDLGYGDIGCFGHPTINTPNLDRMAQEGMKLTQFYVAASVSTPSRGALLTGRLPLRNGSVNVYFPYDTVGLAPYEITIAEQLKTAGYATACVGKWHLGHLPQFLPTNQGFDEYFGLPYSNDMHPKKGRENYPPLPLIEGEGKIEEVNDQSQLTRRYTERSIDFIKRNKNRPFFLYLAHNMPHTPLHASDAFRGKSKRGLYGDVVEELDWSVGQVLQTLKDEGIDENTFVVFTSDNGPWLLKELHGGSAGLLKEGKNTPWEGGMRVPAIVWQPGTVKANTVSATVCSSMDLFPTFSKLAGVPVPADRIYDGKEISSLWGDPSWEEEREIVYYHYDTLYAIRKGAYKLHINTIVNPYQKNKIIEERDVRRLYNVETDPGEKYDIAAGHPEIVTELLQAISRHRETMQ